MSRSPRPSGSSASHQEEICPAVWKELIALGSRLMAIHPHSEKTCVMQRVLPLRHTELDARLASTGASLFNMWSPLHRSSWGLGLPAQTALKSGIKDNRHYRRGFRFGTVNIGGNGGIKTGPAILVKVKTRSRR